MHFLIVSRQGVVRNNKEFKIPGVRLAEELANDGIFVLLDVPATMPKLSPSNFLQFILDFLSALKKISRMNRLSELYFYNYHLAYVPVYFLYLLLRRKRPSLFLADGLNCFGMGVFGVNNFLKLFTKIVSVPYINKNRLSLESRLIWFPGYAKLTPDIKGKPVNASAKLLYNSSFLAHNYPERLISIARDNPNYSVCATGLEFDFRVYLETLSDKFTDDDISKITFLGTLSLQDYFSQVLDSLAIILIRDESIFENSTNFPSKFIEALRLNVPLISLYHISGVSSDLYFLNSNLKIDTNALRLYSEFSKTKTYSNLAEKFLEQCNGERLRSWLYQA